MVKHRRHRIAFIVFGGLVAIFGFSAIVMILWNLVIPQVFGITQVSYWQAMGLFVLAHVLVKSGRPYHYLHGLKHERWRKMMDDQICRMSPEQRKEFFSEWENRLRHFGAEGEKPSTSI
ncbi:MAG TPA: hypothetical protein VMG09_05500 [Bacteroidota bacterium]|nr:hypothetical protein [Bacteroidota bacterium]